MVFKKAERKQTHLKIAIQGPSGSGKTYSSLRMASALAKCIGSRIAVIDTENRSAALYSDKFDFDLCELEPPFSVAKYQDAVRSAIEAGYKVIVIDSISHQWAAEGGILDKKARMDLGGGNSFTHWAKLTPEQEQFRSLILQSNVHLICTMRSKQEYVLEKNDKGKDVPIKKGMAPIQREGFEYEFTTVFDIDMAHQGSISKDRTGLFDGMLEQVTEATGKKLFTWLQDAKPSQPVDEFKNTPMEEPPVEHQFKPVEPTKPPAPTGSGAACALCETELVLNSTKVGYLCPKQAIDPTRGHTRFMAEKLDLYRQNKPFKQQKTA